MQSGIVAGVFRLTLTVVFALGAIVAPSALAADVTIAPDPAAQEVAALDGTVVWVSGEFGSQALMETSDAGARRVVGAPTATAYRSINLGRNRRGALVLTYLRCTTAARCTPYRDDLRGHRARMNGLTLARCSLSTAPALWATRAAYGLDCHTGHPKVFDARRSGLYVKTGAGGPRRLPLPKDAVNSGSMLIDSVDLRGTRVAAVAADIAEYAFSETVTGARTRSFLAALSEGDSDEHVRGLSLGTGNALWALVDAEHAGDPNQAIIHRLRGGCRDFETLSNPPGPDQESGFRATGLAVDGQTVYLVVPGTGIVTHRFAPGHSCTRSAAMVAGRG
jgi:hypothetical protein